MPNYCEYTMRVRGRVCDVLEFIEVMKADYSYTDEEKKCSFDRHIGGRVFSANVEEVYRQDQEMVVEIFGDCAWSVRACMLDGNSTYYYDLKKYGYSTHLKKESEYLNLEIDVRGMEPGLGFSERYFFKNGECLDEAEEEYCYYDLGDLTKEEIEKHINDGDFKREEAELALSGCGFIETGEFTDEVVHWFEPGWPGWHD